MAGWPLLAGRMRVQRNGRESGCFPLRVLPDWPGQRTRAATRLCKGTRQLFYDPIHFLFPSNLRDGRREAAVMRTSPKGGFCLS